MQHNSYSAAMGRPPERLAAAPRPLAKFLMHPAAKPLLFVACVLPFLWLLYSSASGTLGDNPVKALIHQTGNWALYFLYFTLCITPLRQMTGQTTVLRFRRTLGLFAFFYAVVHFFCYAWLDKGLDVQAILNDIQKRPAAIAGTLALLLLIPMAATAFNGAIKALGVKRWQAVHKAIYAIVVLVVVHFFLVRWGKSDMAEVAFNAVIVGLLLGWRVWFWLKRNLEASQQKSMTEHQIAPEIYAFLEAIDRRHPTTGNSGNNAGY